MRASNIDLQVGTFQRQPAVSSDQFLSHAPQLSGQQRCEESTPSHRGKDEAQDLALEKDLLADEKEIAEHLMLIDLGRNDLGRIAKIGSGGIFCF